MRIFRHPDDVPDAHRGIVVALGSFDGFHRGHQTVINAAGRIAAEMRVGLGVMTTEPHPRLFFKPDQDPFLLTPFRAKAHVLEAFGVDILHVLNFDDQLAAMPAYDFVTEVLLKGFGALHVVVGYDYCFGRGRSGNATLLSWMGEMEGFGVSVVAPVGVGVEGAAGEIYSSTLIRQALQNGKARTAAAFLGHWWSIEGHVIAGDQRGRTIGFPTANLGMAEYLRPRFGVYAIRLRRGFDGAVLNGVANIGVRPTFDKTEPLLEAHLFDFSGDLYGEAVAVELVAFIRPEKKFNNINDLKAQIARDAIAARLALADPENAADRFPPPRMNIG